MVRKRIAECNEVKMRCVKQKDRAGALTAMRDAKAQEVKFNNLENMRRMCLNAIEGLNDGAIVRETVGALSSVSAELHGKLDTDKLFRELESAADGIVQMRDDLTEMDSIMASGAAGGVDDSELEAELDALIMGDAAGGSSTTLSMEQEVPHVTHLEAGFPPVPVSSRGDGGKGEPPQQMPAVPANTPAVSRVRNHPQSTPHALTHNKMAVD